MFTFLNTMQQLEKRMQISDEDKRFIAAAVIMGGFGGNPSLIDLHADKLASIAVCHADALLAALRHQVDPPISQD